MILCCCLYLARCAMGAIPDSRHPAGRRLPLALSLVALLAWFALSGLWSPTPDIARVALSWLATFGIFFLVILIRGISRYERIQFGATPDAARRARAHRALYAGASHLRGRHLQGLPRLRQRRRRAQPVRLLHWTQHGLRGLSDADRLSCAGFLPFSPHADTPCHGAPLPCGGALRRSAASEPVGLDPGRYPRRALRALGPAPRPRSPAALDRHPAAGRRGPGSAHPSHRSAVESPPA